MIRFIKPVNGMKMQHVQILHELLLMETKGTPHAYYITFR